MPNRVAFDGEAFLLAFRVEAGVLDAVRMITGRRFNADSKIWSAPKSSASEVRSVAERYGFSVTAEAQAVISTAEATGVGGTPAARSIRLAKNRIEIAFEYDAVVVADVRSIIGRRFDPATKRWYIPLEPLPGLADSIRGFAERNGFSIDTAAAEALLRIDADTSRAIAQSRSLSSTIVIPQMNGELRPFQRAGVEYAMDKKRLIIGDVVGLGKSVQALATVEAAGALPALIITTASMKLAWAGSKKQGVVSEIDKWLPARRYAVLDGKGVIAGSMENAEYVIINYDLLGARMADLLEIPFKAVIGDEFHFVKSAKAKRTVATKQLMARPSVRYRIGLSGTSVLSRPAELISQLEAIGRLTEFGGFWTFAQRYCGAYRDAFGLNISGATNLEELNARLRATCYVRREKRDVMTELPAVDNQPIPIDIDNRREYAKAEADVIAWLGARAERLAEVNGLADEERKIVRREAEERAARAEALVRIGTLNQVIARGKLTGVNAWLEDYFAGSDEKIIVFASHREIVDGLAKEWSCPVIYGGMTARERQAVVEKFQTDPKCRMIVANIIAAGEGLTLTAAKSVAFVEMEWTPSRHDQAIGRAYGRINDAHGVTAYWFLARDTIDEDRMELLNSKREVVNITLTGEAGEVAEAKMLSALTKRLLGRAS